MSIVERMRGSIERKRDPLKNYEKLTNMVEAGRSPRVIVSSVDYNTGEGDYVLLIPPKKHSWLESEVIPLDSPEDIALFSRDGARPAAAIVRRVDRKLISNIHPYVPDLFALVNDPFFKPPSDQTER